MALLLLLLLFPISTHSSCNPPHNLLLSLAFSSVSNFRPPPPSPCLLHLLLPSQNLSGTVSWLFLRNITTLRSLDLSHNSLVGSIPSPFFSSPSLTHLNLANNRLGGPLRFQSSPLLYLNLSANRFTAASNLPNLTKLKTLDLSRNKLCFTPPALNSLSNIDYLDLSHNSMAGEFPRDFPAIARLRFLNVSYNNLTGEIDDEALDKFGRSAFVKGGVFSYGEKKVKKRGKFGTWRKVVIGSSAAAVVVVVFVAGVLCFGKRRLVEKEEKKEVSEEEIGWVREARWGAAVVMIEKPLMELTFGDLAGATCGFGRESLMAEGGRSGPVYRAVLPGDLHVVVRVMERDRGVDAGAAEEVFKEIGKLRHRNLLPLLGYCISGREKLLLYEYMERGDLRRWLNELPDGQPAIEDWTGDTWENLPTDARPSSIGDWPTRHRIPLGVARGLAFLHQGWVGSHKPVVHGHLIPSNILLSIDLEPRIADLASSACDATAEDDVYSYGVVIIELLTGRSDWAEEEVERFRAMIRGGSVSVVVALVDRRMQLEAEWEKEAVECLRVGYLCTAKAPEKRPTMQQVVALLKDIRSDLNDGVDRGGNMSPSY